MVYSHVSLKWTFFLPFQNGLNEFLWRCSHMTLKFFKKSLAKMVTLAENVNKALWYTRLLHVQHVSSWTVLNVKCGSGWIDQSVLTDHLFVRYTWTWTVQNIWSFHLESLDEGFAVEVKCWSCLIMYQNRSEVKLQLQQENVAFGLQKLQHEKKLISLLKFYSK